MSNVNRQRSFLGFVVAGAIALLVIVIFGFYWFFVKSPVNLTASSSQPGATIFVSKLAPVMVSLLTNPDSLQALEREGELSKLKTSFLAKSGIDYKQDIQPWLGNEITLAVTTLDMDRDLENGKQPGYLMALATNKPDKSREFVELLFSKRVLAGANLTVEQYEGAKLLYDNSRSQQDSLAGAVVDGFVLFANDPKVLRDAINNVQAPDLNLNSFSQYQKAAQKLPKGSIALAFLNLPTVAQWQGLELSQPNYNSEIISLSLNPKGVLAETSFLTSSAIVPPSPLLSKPVEALKYIPVSAGLAISGANLNDLSNSNLAQLWAQVKTAISGSGTDVISRLVQPLADIQKSKGIDLQEDIFSWVKGEYAIALLPREDKITPDWLFAVEKLEDVAAGISRLDAIASANGLSTNSLNLDKQKIFAWTELKPTVKQSDAKDRSLYSIEAKVQGVHTTLDNYEIFASNLETLNEVITVKENSLNNNRSFQNSIAAIPQPNQGYLYLDWKKSQPLLERQLPVLKLLEVVGKPFFNNLRSLTVSSYGSEPESIKNGLFFQFYQ
ncbi:DUF3352 domain-containing protein [Nostocaceae cyanobacterium CENA369]|uniref:DUF3352 domain-containing protein n=1 Tax=Dendronalium phyllosphericum CENA369 TaxID=1725256 RepID=A0A8J7I0Y3_9NOST|nr:DUF3352 domain-containing protein [Dendronalium phyllosphericum]MBH8572118.1 DUF3352 domain-containing protein [Dendronalium phyllosphericum CENA369]